MTGKRGLGLFASPVNWPALMALRPDALVCIDPYHLPPYPAGGCQYLWRPWAGTRVLRNLTPAEYVNRVMAEWGQKGRPHFDAIQFLNEPNLEQESGYPAGSREAAQAAVDWGLAVVALLRTAWPGAEIASPPLSPCVEPYLEFWEWLRPLVDFCDVVAVHRYFDNRYTLGAVHKLYPDRGMVVTELGRPASGSLEYGQELLSYWRALESLPYVRWGAAFQWQVVPEFAAWGLDGTPAAALLAGAAE